MAGTGRMPPGTGGSADREGAVGLALLAPPASLPPVPTLARAAVINPCTCGHGRAEHEHFRAGSDCAACGGSGCGRFRPVRGLSRRRLPGRHA
jgi:hypothetical protein